MGPVFHLDWHSRVWARGMERRSDWRGHHHPWSTGGPEVFLLKIGGILGCGRIPLCCEWDLEVVQYPRQNTTNGIDSYSISELYTASLPMDYLVHRS